ncbi:serine acetyltransferase [Klebsiella pneumoniae]|uniref:Serine acetyltransferase n=1 Tax=Klebsiella pneumoniae TaxID=573 RepID=A0A378FSV1_KLEPN|nr:serine acetyltransferase [Klebsiella pneumoniae]
MIGAGAKILGNIEVGRGAKIGAGSVVLQPVPPHTTAAGVPARIVGKPESDKPAMDMDQHFNRHPPHLRVRRRDLMYCHLPLLSTEM